MELKWAQKICRSLNELRKGKACNPRLLYFFSKLATSDQTRYLMGNKDLSRQMTHWLEQTSKRKKARENYSSKRIRADEWHDDYQNKHSGVKDMNFSCLVQADQSTDVHLGNHDDTNARGESDVSKVQENMLDNGLAEYENFETGDVTHRLDMAPSKSLVSVQVEGFVQNSPIKIVLTPQKDRMDTCWRGNDRLKFELLKQFIEDCPDPNLGKVTSGFRSQIEKQCSYLKNNEVFHNGKMQMWKEFTKIGTMADKLIRTGFEGQRDKGKRNGKKENGLFMIIRQVVGADAESFEVKERIDEIMAVAKTYMKN